MEISIAPLLIDSTIRAIIVVMKNVDISYLKNKKCEQLANKVKDNNIITFYFDIKEKYKTMDYKAYKINKHVRI